MIRRPPRSTLFPTRRSSDLTFGLKEKTSSSLGNARAVNFARKSSSYFKIRSEEHTSELQSHLNLVCRLLLENKKEDGHQRVKFSLVDKAERQYRHHHSYVVL